MRSKKELHTRHPFVKKPGLPVVGQRWSSLPFHLSVCTDDHSLLAFTARAAATLALFSGNQRVSFASLLWRIQASQQLLCCNFSHLVLSLYFFRTGLWPYFCPAEQLRMSWCCCTKPTRDFLIQLCCPLLQTTHLQETHKLARTPYLLLLPSN